MTGVTTARSDLAVVAAGHPEACRAALEVLAENGSAVDAAVAATLVLTVVCPHAATLGGDGFVLVRSAPDGRVAGINGSGRAPAAALPDRFAEGIPRTGWLSATVPGLLGALAEALARFGRLPLDRLLAPAIALARDGFEVDANLARNASQRAAVIAPDPEAASLFQPGGKPLAARALLRQADLADTLDAIARDGLSSFYRGPLAQRFAEAVAGAGGLIAASDLACHGTLWQEPIFAPFRGRSVLTMPPNSYGLTLLLQLLALDRGGIAEIDPDSADFVLRGLAARRQAYRTGAGVIADPVSSEAEARILLGQVIAGTAAEPEAPMPAEAEGGTTNVVVLDRLGNAVSLVASVSAPFGAGVVVPGTGILLNNRMGGFGTAPGSPNRIGPGRRPAHTLTPAMVLGENGRPELVLGTPGQAGQTCTLAQFLARLMACGQPVEDAIAAPRWSVDLQGKPIVEGDMDADLVRTLQAEEPELRTMPRGWITFGSVKAVRAGPDGLEAYADRRRSAHAAGL